MQAKKTELLETFAARLRAAMSRKGLTLQQLAERCGVAVSTVGAWTQAKNWPQVEIQARLADHLGVSIAFLYHGITESAEPPHAELPSVVAEDSAPYGTGEMIAREIRRDIEALLAAAKNDPQRLHWVAEQIKAHLAEPRHWKTGAVRLGRIDPQSATGQPMPSSSPLSRSA